MSVIAKTIKAQSDRGFGIKPTFLVDADSPSPSGITYSYIKALTAVTGFEATDILLEEGSGDYPTALVANTELISSFKDISVTTGTLFCKRF